MRFGKARALTATLLTLALPKAAHASAFYVESDIGVANLLNSSTLLPGAPASFPLGFDVNMGLFFDFSNGGAFELQIGVLDRYQLLTSSGTYYSLNTLYPVLRAQFSMIYLSFGASPWMWTRVSQTAGLVDGLTQTTTALSYLGEVGLIWGVTPAFSLAVTGAAQIVDNGGGSLGPNPGFDIFASMRFYFGWSASHGQHTSDEWHGWRYPFGNEK